MTWAARNMFGLLWAFLWLVCLFVYVPFVSDAGYLPKLIGFATLLLVGFLIIPKEAKLQYNHSMVFLSIIILASIPSLIFSVNLGDGALVIIRWFIVMLLVAFISLAQASVDFKDFAVKASSMALLVLSIWGFGEWIFSLEGLELTHQATYNVSASLGHRNLYVQYLALLMPLTALGLAKKGLWKIVSLLAILLSIFLIIVLLNRTAWFTCAIYALAVVIALLSFKGTLSDDRKKQLFMLSVFTVVCLIGALFLVDELYTIVHHFETLFDISEGTTRDRVLLAQRSLELFQEHPLFGVGAGMWKIAIMGFSQEGMLTNSARIFYQRPHNDYLWIFSESGFLAGVSFLFLHILATWTALKAWIKERSNLSLMVLLSWIGFIIASLTSFPIERPEYLLFFAMLLGLTFRNHAIERSRFSKAILRFVSILSIVLLLIRIGGESNYLKGKTAQTSSSWQESKQLMEASQSALFQIDALSLPLQHHVALAQFQLGNVESAAHHFNEALQINPYHPETWNNLGICAASNNDLDSALNCFIQAVRYTTSYQDAWLNIAIIQYNQGQWRTSFRSFLKADSAQSTENYQQLGTLLSIDSLSRMLSRVPDRKMMNTLEALRNTPEWAFSIIQKSAYNDIPFHQQAYIDACFFMLKHCEEYEDCDLVEEIIDQYLPGGKADLNLNKE